ncbi:PH domain-containing protein [Thermomonospora umbrina]|uniref:Putative membrane protein n=1 Tax=Thermomonospora umbrina TaxID=111806 RepID=A0A3D9SZD9_9ACTN|nr:PH domain-containing protein [Thermomonospora umbrina]REE97944.1 putative membrane protein [Thermomonospora umbrina]
MTGPYAQPYPAAHGAYPPAVYGPPGFGPHGYGPPPVRYSEGVHRVHPATTLLRAFAVFVIYFVLLGFPLLLTRNDDGIVLFAPEAVLRFALVSAPVAVAALVIGVWGWRSQRFWFAEGDLAVETGLLRKRRRLIPLSRIQAIDVIRPLMTRLTGLAEVRVELAGGDQSEIALRYLGRRDAWQLRAELLARAAGLPGHTPEAPEQPFWRVGFRGLFGSLVMKIPVIATGLVFLSLFTVGILFLELGFLGAVIPALLGLIRAVVAPLVMYGNFTAATSPDGLRLRYGLLETRMQTVPPGRVQAVSIVEPVLWRQKGWARVDVTVAGYAGERQALSSVLLPVAPRAVAVALVAQVFPGADIDAIPLLPAASKGLSLDRSTAAGTDDVVFVTRRGLLCRRTEVIAHARAQSVRLTAGPLQRLFGIGTVHVDAPPGPVRVTAADRDLSEARLIVEATAERARVARSRGGSDPARWAR